MASGVVRLQLDTHNPTALVAGDSFWGSEIVTHREFSRGTGLRVRARVRLVDPLERGIVASFFTYALRGSARDEIDFELLTNNAGRNSVLTNVFRNDGFTSAGHPQLVMLPAFQPADFNELEIEWRPDRIVWKVNGAVVRTETAVVPDGPMTLRFNLWVPDANFADAYDAALQPAASAQTNRRFFYEIDFVEVRALS